MDLQNALLWHLESLFPQVPVAVLLLLTVLLTILGPCCAIGLCVWRFCCAGRHDSMRFLKLYDEDEAPRKGSPDRYAAASHARPCFARVARTFLCGTRPGSLVSSQLTARPIPCTRVVCVRGAWRR